MPTWAEQDIGGIEGRVTTSESDITSLDGRVSQNEADIAALPPAYVHPNHSGDVTSVADGAQTLVAGSASVLNSGTLAVARGGTGAGALTQNSVVFVGASGVYSQDNTNFAWDDAADTFKGANILAPTKLTVGQSSLQSEILHANWAAGTYGSGVQTGFILQSTGGGNASATNLRAFNFGFTLSGANAANELTAFTGDIYWSGSSGTLASGQIMSANVRHQGAATMTEAFGYRAILLASSTGTTGTWICFEARTPTSSSTGAVTNSYGMWVRNQGISGKNTNAIGVRVSAQSGGSGINAAVYFDDTGGGRAAGITWNNDTFLYRSAANTLRCEDNLTVDTAIQINGTQVVNSRKTGWGAPTGTATRTTFATSTVTLEELAQRVKGLVDDLSLHGLIGA